MNAENIIGRAKEISLLKKWEQSGKHEFVAIYGRRRVGKTFLVDQLFGKKLCFAFSGSYHEPKATQLRNFAIELAARQGNAKISAPSSWTDAFWALQQYLESIRRKGKRIILFFDELPWIDTPKSGFVRALDYFWNHYASKHKEIMLIVCGSATSWMVNKLINDKGGLHNRVTREMHIFPFTLCEVEQYLRHTGFKWTRKMIAQVYMILGGIPYYLDMLDKDMTLPANIDNLLFNKGAQLKGEYKRLYDSLFGRSEIYTKIISILNKNGKGLTRLELQEKIKSNSGGSLSNALTDLVNCDFIEYRKPSNTRANKSSGLYILVDFFTLFHFHFIQATGDTENFWAKMSNSPKISAWQGLAFERLCLAHTKQIHYALHIDTIQTHTFTWRSKSGSGAQIDMVIERADGMTHVCEMKFWKGDYALDAAEAKKLENRVNAYTSESKTKNGTITTLITTEGVANNKYSHIIDRCITLDALFEDV